MKYNFAHMERETCITVKYDEISVKYINKGKDENPKMILMTIYMKK
jgi:hypothetical protein